LPKTRGATIENRDNRLRALDEIMDRHCKKSQRPSNAVILKELNARGFTITGRQLYNDLTELAINDTFVQDLASKSYSKIIHDACDSITFVDTKAREILNKTWTQDKTIKKKTPDGVEIITHTTEEMAEPHLKALKLISENAETMTKIVSGDAIKVAAKSWSMQRIKDKARITELESELQELKIAKVH
jgi:hypothetical protein